MYTAASSALTRITVHLVEGLLGLGETRTFKPGNKQRRFEKTSIKARACLQQSMLAYKSPSKLTEVSWLIRRLDVQGWKVEVIKSSLKMKT